MNIEIRLERDDTIPAMAGFLRCEPPDDNNNVILMNVAGIMLPEGEDEQGNPVPMSREVRLRGVIESLMHEFGHLLESHMRLPVNEDAIEKACASWESAFDKARKEGTI